MRVFLLDKEASMPVQGTDGSAGFDLQAVSRNGVGDLIVYGTGISVEIPKGWMGLLCARSSVRNTGLVLANGVGIIDSDFRGELVVTFRRMNRDKPIYEIGKKVAQLVLVPCYSEPLVEITSEERTETGRGTGGHGSTGV